MPITILVRNNGPYRISVEDAPEVRIVDHAGNVLVPTPGKPISLCCGASTKKPSCDGTHKQLCFEPPPDGDAASSAPTGATTGDAPAAGGTPG